MSCGKLYPPSKQVKTRFLLTCCYIKTLQLSSYEYIWIHFAPPPHTHTRTSCNLVPAGTQRLEEAEAIDGDQSSRVENAQLFMLWQDEINIDLLTNMVWSGRKSPENLLWVHHLLSYSRMTRDLVRATLESQYRILLQQLGQEQNPILVIHNQFSIWYYSSWLFKNRSERCPDSFICWLSDYVFQQWQSSTKRTGEFVLDTVVRTSV